MMIISIVIIIIVTWCAQTSFLPSVEKGRGITSGICWAHLMVLQLLLLPHNIILLPETAAGLQYHDWYWGCVLQCVIFILRYLQGVSKKTLFKRLAPKKVVSRAAS